MWTVISSTTAPGTGAPSCILTDNGACISDGDGNYHNDAKCTVRADAAFFVDATYFDVENYFDHISKSATRGT